MAHIETMVEHRLDTEGADPLMLAGVNDRNIHEMERLFSVQVVMRHDQLVLRGLLRWYRSRHLEALYVRRARMYVLFTH